MSKSDLQRFGPDSVVTGENGTAINSIISATSANYILDLKISRRYPSGQDHVTFEDNTILRDEQMHTCFFLKDPLKLHLIRQ